MLLNSDINQTLIRGINLALISLIVFSSDTVRMSFYSDTLLLHLLCFCSDTILIYLLNGANSKVVINSDKSFYEHCLHSNIFNSIVLSLIVSDRMEEST